MTSGESVGAQRVKATNTRTREYEAQRTRPHRALQVEMPKERTVWQRSSPVHAQFSLWLAKWHQPAFRWNGPFTFSDR